MKIFILFALAFSITALATVKVGTEISNLSGITQDGQSISLASELKNDYVLIYFFPKADTPGCTKQACSLRDEYAKLQTKKVKIYGVSTTDTPQELKAFQKKYNIPFTFISDTKQELAKKLDVPVNGGYASRQAFLIKNEKIVWLDRSASTAEQAQDILNYLGNN